MLKVNSVLGVSKVVTNKQVAKKAVLPTVAGVTGLSVLSGASGGPSWQFEGVRPREGEVRHCLGSVDDGPLETIAKKIDYMLDHAGLSDEVDAVKEFVGDSVDGIKEFFEKWGEAIADTVDTYY